MIHLLVFQNAAAHLIFRLHRSEHITDALVSLHWLQVPEWIILKAAMQIYQALHTDTLLYLWQFTHTSDVLS